MIGFGLVHIRGRNLAEGTLGKELPATDRIVAQPCLIPLNRRASP